MLDIFKKKIKKISKLIIAFLFILSLSATTFVFYLYTVLFKANGNFLFMYLSTFAMVFVVSVLSTVLFIRILNKKLGG